MTSPPYRTVVSIQYMATRRDDLTREAARLFAARGFHGTSMGDLAAALGVQKGSLYSLTGSKQELLFETMREGARAFHAALDAIPEDAPAVERVRVALRGHLEVVARQLDVATVFTREWRYLEEPYRGQIRAERRRYEERFRALFREGVEKGELRSDLDAGAAALLVLSAANWAYTWLAPGRDTDELADRFTAIVVDGIRGYATPSR
jgi:TetR/AcrR family transcriptional regulator, cholesterol catabolism regulator